MVHLKKWYKMSTFEEIRPEFEISSEVKSVDIHVFEGVDHLHHSGVEGRDLEGAEHVGMETASRRKEDMVEALV